MIGLGAYANVDMGMDLWDGHACVRMCGPGYGCLYYMRTDTCMHICMDMYTDIRMWYVQVDHVYRHGYFQPV